MMNVPENELFSAYLDGELTAAEQADVERLLATSPAARQLVDDLRALSSTLQSLPVRKLDEDLSQQVLRLAEHRVLSGRTDSDSFPREPVVSTSRWQVIARRLSRPRIWVWPGLAVAVGLLLMVLHPEQAQRLARQPVEKHVALAPADAPRALSEPPAIGAAADADREGQAGETEVMLRTSRATEKSVERPAAAVGHVSNVPFPESAAVEAKKDAAKVPPRPAAVPATPPAPAAPPPARPMKVAKEDLPPDVRPAKEGPGERAEKAPEEVTIVLCDVTREAIELRFVEKTLAKRQVVLLGRPAKDSRDRGRPAGGGFAQVEMEEKSEVAARDADFAERDDKRATHLGAAVDSGEIVYLRAEATPAQLEAVLVDLRSRPEMVRSLSRESRVAGPVADGEVGFFFGKAAQLMKKSADVAPGQAPAAQTAGSGAAGASQTAEPLEPFEANVQKANVQNRPAEARSAGGARGAAQSQKMQDEPATANTVESDSAANRSQNAQMQRRASGKPAQEGQEMHGQMRQRAIDATQAGGTRMTGPGVKTADRKARQRGQQSDESSPQIPTDAAMAPAQQAMPAGQAAAMPGYGSPSAAMAKGKSLADASADAEAQAHVKRRVVFVLRAVGPNPSAAEKSGKTQAVDAKAAAAKAAPMRAEAAKSAESSKPAAAAPAAPK